MLVCPTCGRENAGRRPVLQQLRDRPEPRARHAQGAQVRHGPVRRSGRLDRARRARGSGGRPVRCRAHLRPALGGDRPLRGAAREVHGRRRPRRLRRPARPRGRRGTGGARRPGDAGDPVRAEPRVRGRGQADAEDAHRGRVRRGARRRRARVRTAGPDADGRRGEHRRPPADGGRAGPDRGRAQRLRQHQGRHRVPSRSNRSSSRARPIPCRRGTPFASRPGPAASGRASAWRPAWSDATRSWPS